MSIIQMGHFIKFRRCLLCLFYVWNSSEYYAIINLRVSQGAIGWANGALIPILKNIQLAFQIPKDLWYIFPTFHFYSKIASCLIFPSLTHIELKVFQSKNQLNLPNILLFIPTRLTLCQKIVPFIKAVIKVFYSFCT